LAGGGADFAVENAGAVFSPYIRENAFPLVMISNVGGGIAWLDRISGVR
jgi:hypothetical protein